MSETLDAIESELDSTLPGLLPLPELLEAAATDRMLSQERIQRLRDLGWHLALLPEPSGLGLAHEGVARLAVLAGRHLLPAYLAAEAFLLAPALQAAAEAGDARAADWLRDLLGGRLGGGGGVAMESGAMLWLAPTAVVAAIDAGESVVLADLVRHPAAGRPGLDGGQGLARLDGMVAAAEVASPAAAAVLRFHRVSLLAQAVGVVEAVLERTRLYAVQREQFGQPIASFQAVAHRIAGIKVAHDSGRSALARLVALIEGGDLDAADALGDALAYSLPEAARRAVEDAIQVHGGMGFTWEYGLHLWYRRALSIQSMLGGRRAAARRAGRAYIAQRRRLREAAPVA